MRCLSCNCELSDYEATRKFKDVQIYIDLCNSCYSKSEFDDSDNVVSSPTTLERQLDEQEYYEES